MDYIKQSLKKIFIPVLVYSLAGLLLTLFLTGLKRGLVNLDVRGFWGFNYPSSMPFHPENYTYIDELINIINTLLNLTLIIGFRRYCIKKLNEESCNTKEAFFFGNPKCFLRALLCEYAPSLVTSKIDFVYAFSILSVSMVIGIPSLSFNIGFTILGVYFWLTPYIYI